MHKTDDPPDIPQKTEVSAAIGGKSKILQNINCGVKLVCSSCEQIFFFNDLTATVYIPDITV